MVEALWSRVVFHHLTDQNEWHVAFVYLTDKALMRLNLMYCQAMKAMRPAVIAMAPVAMVTLIALFLKL